MGTKRDLAAIEARRLQGDRMLKRKAAQAEVAREMGVSRQAVSLWAKQLTAVNGAIGKLKGKPLGRPKCLEVAQCEALGSMLLKGSLASGFPTELWTVKRVRALVNREFGVAYSNTGCWELLRSLGFTPQKPERRATQRDEAAIMQWKRKGWLALEKARREGRTIVFIDESGLSDKCSVTRTWGLRGHTPVIQQSFTWKQMSAIAGLSWWRFYFRFFDGAIRSEQIVGFLTALTSHIRKPLLTIWDGVGPHKSRRVKRWLDEQDGRIAIAFLPPYAPELNPVEAIWAYLKKHEIADLCPTHLAEVSAFARRRLKSMPRRAKLIRTFWQQVELAL